MWKSEKKKHSLLIVGKREEAATIGHLVSTTKEMPKTTNGKPGLFLQLTLPCVANNWGELPQFMFLFPQPLCLSFSKSIGYNLT